MCAAGCSSVKYILVDGDFVVVFVVDMILNRELLECSVANMYRYMHVVCSALYVQVLTIN